MSINSVPISARNAPYSPAITAGGGYTLPQYAFIPSPVLQQLQSGRVTAPSLGGEQTGSYIAGTAIASRPYPIPSANGAWAIRQATVKTLPTGDGY